MILVLAVTASCHTPKNTTAPKPITDFDKQGHRGSRGLMPENTIPAMLKAIDLDVTTLEMDLGISKDKQVVVSHDPYFSENITTTPEGRVRSLMEVRKFAGGVARSILSIPLLSIVSVPAKNESAGKPAVNLALAIILPPG